MNKYQIVTLASLSLPTLMGGCAYQENCPNGNCIVSKYDVDAEPTDLRPGTVSIGPFGPKTYQFISPELQGKGFRRSY